MHTRTHKLTHTKHAIYLIKVKPVCITRILHYRGYVIYICMRVCMYVCSRVCMYAFMHALFCIFVLITISCHARHFRCIVTFVAAACWVFTVCDRSGTFLHFGSCNPIRIYQAGNGTTTQTYLYPLYYVSLWIRQPVVGSQFPIFIIFRYWVPWPPPSGYASHCMNPNAKRKCISLRILLN